MLDLFGSRGIPPEIAEHIFHLAGPGAWTNVRCTNQANAAAYSGVGVSLTKLGLWRCHVNSPELHQFAVEHRLRSLRLAPYSNITSLYQVTPLEWLTELRIENYDRAKFDPGDLQQLVFPPRLVTLELMYLGFLFLPPLPDEATLKRLVWFEDTRASLTYSTGPLPSSLLHLQCYIWSFLELPPVLPPHLEYLSLLSACLPTPARPVLPATLRYFRFLNLLQADDSTWLPDQLPSQLKHLCCSDNRLAVIPALPAGLTHLDCSGNSLTSPLPALPDSLLHLACDDCELSALPTLPASLTYLSCTRNSLEKLPALPESLCSLSCIRNHRLTSLPALPGGLEELRCDSGLVDGRNLPATLRRRGGFNR